MINDLSSRSRTARVAVETALADLQTTFTDDTAQGSRAYVSQMRVDHPELDSMAHSADAVVAVREIHRQLQSPAN